MNGSIPKYMHYDGDLYRVYHITDEFDDNNGMFKFIVNCRVVHIGMGVSGIQMITRWAKHRKEFSLTEEQAKDQYPEYFI